MEHTRGTRRDERTPVKRSSQYSDDDPAVRSWEQNEALKAQTRTRRVFSASQLFAFSLTYMSSWEAVLGNLYYALYNGGPSTLTWSLVIVLFGITAQAASLSEMASILPMAGAQYLWTWRIAPPKIRRFATWVQGWITWVGYISILASSANVAVLFLQSVIEIGHIANVFQGWHTSLLITSMVVILASVNIYGIKTLPWILTIAGILHIALFFFFVVVMAVMGSRRSAEFVFLETTASSGWDGNAFVSWNVGALTSVWSFVGFEGAIHMGEETLKAKMAVPRAIFWSNIINAILALIGAIATIVAMGSVDDALKADSPIVSILLGVTRSASATSAMIIGMFLVGILCILAEIAMLSRLTWSWARDGGLPIYFAFIDPKHRVPVRAIVLNITIVCCLSLLNIGSATYIALNAVASLSALALYISYFIAISSMLYARYGADRRLELGVWNWGRWGGPINVFALAYTVYMAIWLPFPSDVPVTGANMNYCGPVMGSVLLLAVLSWFVWARRNWAGPNPAIMDFVIASS